MWDLLVMFLAYLFNRPKPRAVEASNAPVEPPPAAAPAASPPFIEIKRVSLGPQHLQPDGVGITIWEGGVMEPHAPFVELRIARYEGVDSFYIFHNAADGQSTDTWYESLEEALRDAEDTYGVKESEWTDTNIVFGSDEPS